MTLWMALLAPLGAIGIALIVAGSIKIIVGAAPRKTVTSGKNTAEPAAAQPPAIPWPERYAGPYKIEIGSCVIFDCGNSILEHKQGTVLKIDSDTVAIRVSKNSSPANKIVERRLAEVLDARDFWHTVLDR